MMTLRVSKGRVTVNRPQESRVVTDKMDIDPADGPFSLDYEVGAADFMLTTTGLIADLNQDGRVDFADLQIMKGEFFAVEG